MRSTVGVASGGVPGVRSTLVQGPQLFPSSDSAMVPVPVPELLSAHARTYRLSGLETEGNVYERVAVKFDEAESAEARTYVPISEAPEPLASFAIWNRLVKPDAVAVPPRFEITADTVVGAPPVAAVGLTAPAVRSTPVTGVAVTVTLAELVVYVVVFPCWEAILRQFTVYERVTGG